ncbi:TetR/AcrR family transcriptional regulator [Rhodococcus opacus]|uniref:TetR/AcrR family transcriptional regulator n=1 Tax=Rhodococcus opacus TaxID=37919 RepID=UPI001FF35634|nr:TetR/AcrR family transcriptional regulator [Rhodococcus opacus]UOT03736.1 TetR/AcrR family transcriptional regulator [Rhodococcus opacus]
MKADQMPSTAPTVRPSRRELLLRVAADLFLHKPYDSVTVEMICAKAGISAPGLYRHFQNKQALLIAVVENPLEFLHQSARATVESEPDPRAALDAMVEFHIRSVLSAAPTTLIFLKNEHAFPETDRRRIRRAMNMYAEEWISTVSSLRPELSDPEVRLLTQAVFSMLNTVPTLNKGLDQESIVKTMSTAAVQALISPRAE